EWNRAQVAGLAYSGVVHDSGGVYLAGAFTVKDVAGIHAIQQKTITGIALPVGPHGLITQAGVGATAAGKLRVHARGKRGEPGKTTGREGNRFQLHRVEHIAVGSVHSVDQRRLNYGDRLRSLADLERLVQRHRAVRLYENGRHL